MYNKEYNERVLKRTCSACTRREEHSLANILTHFDHRVVI